ncbi:ATP-binding cassette domain-containing protein [Pseudohongiella sp. SYSU M77423]|uniref:ATP-binding cassette domain-containing protein n=1 Tax=unclassified Pseudohongiella TaxID=2629611 RepID=UPI001EFFBCDE|nr:MULTISPECIES: ATP-binding cassette domain-containing protein [unclassified Pseudohongiella]MDH7943598.1 ATP-binding cassette domain-containing protein [Pseudohongiella sp. SYSU M77423]
MTGMTLRLQDIEITLKGQRLLQINAQIEPGATLTVMGPSGAGKSSLLAYIAGFLAPEFQAQGEIWLGERCLNGLPPEQRKVGLLFQDPLLFPHLSVAQNLTFALPADVPDRSARVELALENVGLAGFAERDPATLSGGQKARVSLQRLLLSNPHAVLLDEPFSRLDSHLRQEVRQHVFQTLRDASLPAILVTHDAEDARAADGTVIELG